MDVDTPSGKSWHSPSSIVWDTSCSAAILSANSVGVAAQKLGWEEYNEPSDGYIMFASKLTPTLLLFDLLVILESVAAPVNRATKHSILLATSTIGSNNASIALQ